MMKGLDRTFLRIGTAIAAFVTIAFVVFMINQTAAIVQLATGITPWLGQATLWALLGLYVILLAVPLALFLGLPKPLIPPASTGTGEYQRYLESLGRRLERNPRLSGRSLSTPAEIETAIAALGEEADGIVSSTAGAVFVSTAISQYGRLDAFLVLGAQSRMIWQVAHVFNQRPTLRDMLRLYANVASTVFLASELDDLDIAEQVEPVISGALGSAAAVIPGVQLVAGLVVNSALTGSANAFLTLRVGMITKRYSAPLVKQDQRTLKRAATVEAAGLLGAIAKDGTKAVANAIWGASREKARGAFDSAKDGVVSAGEAVVDASSSVATGVGRGVKSAGSAVADTSVSAVRGVGKGVKSAGSAVGDAGSSLVSKVRLPGRRTRTMTRKLKIRATARVK